MSNKVNFIASVAPWRFLLAFWYFELILKRQAEAVRYFELYGKPVFRCE